ncbi:phosphotransferase family protein [Nocardia harenae]|uniref:phosphotransferase family protein n=1 Tax=Nocardia harenae TaxID=358707 RepID=UPI000A0058C5|nr:phosphotransferase family protein [Nocardia harenae]
MNESVPADVADPALAARVRAALGCGDSARLDVLEGGHSGRTFVVRDGERARVVRAGPAGRPARGRDDVLRQAALIEALRDTGVPLPRVTHREAGEPAWFAMTFEPGEAIEPVLDPAGSVPVPLARARMLAAAEVLGRLHAVPIPELESALSGIGQSAPPALGPADELERWARTMAAVPGDLAEGGAELVAALRAAVPAPVAPVLVHGDFRLGNLLFDGAEPRALIDWEIWSIGDPRVDFGWFEVFTDGRLFPGIGARVDGLPAGPELLDVYRARRGVAAAGIDADSTWFAALSRMKMAAIMGHNLRRHREGRHHDPAQEQLPPVVDALIAAGLALLGAASAPRDLSSNTIGQPS